ncbi:hypothetical protein BC567DRAFT_69488 [Phyllosticta citribraziliensis]
MMRLAGWLAVSRPVGPPPTSLPPSPPPSITTTQQPTHRKEGAANKAYGWRGEPVDWTLLDAIFPGPSSRTSSCSTARRRRRRRAHAHHDRPADGWTDGRPTNAHSEHGAPQRAAHHSQLRVSEGGRAEARLVGVRVGGLGSVARRYERADRRVR